LKSEKLCLCMLPKLKADCLLTYACARATWGKRLRICED